MIKKVLNRVNYEVTKLRYRQEAREVKRLMKDIDTPVYYIHIRKAAGTTINYAFLRSSREPDIDAFFETLAQKPNHRLIRNNQVFVGWNVRLINEGHYSYAFSHAPCHRLNLPPHVFTFTCLRDPVKRVVSHYNYLRNFQVNNLYHPCMEREGGWLGDSLADFIINVPREDLMNQLYTFSASFDVNEAFDRVMQCNHFFFTHEMDAGMKTLEQQLNRELPVASQNKSGYREDIDEAHVAQLRDLLRDEYELLDRLQRERKVTHE